MLIRMLTHHAVVLRCMTWQVLLGALTFQQQNLHHCWAWRLLRILSKQADAACKPPLSISMLQWLQPATGMLWTREWHLLLLMSQQSMETRHKADQGSTNRMLSQTMLLRKLRTETRQTEECGSRNRPTSQTKSLQGTGHAHAKVAAGTRTAAAQFRLLSSAGPCMGRKRLRLAENMKHVCLSCTYEVRISVEAADSCDKVALNAS